MNKYGFASVCAVANFNNGFTPNDSWQIVVNNLFASKSSQEKSCPKNAFLGLCEVGLIRNIPSGNYTKSVKNKSYAVNAVVVLKANPNVNFTPKQLWQQLNLGNKRHNSQMDVVLWLWDWGLIIHYFSI